MTAFSKRNLNRFLLFKLPSAYIAGVRVSKLEENLVEASVKVRWINKNPFNSLFWAVQGMAAELTTGVLLIKHIRLSKKNISMLVTKQSGEFHKKAIGKIKFSCTQEQEVKKLIEKVIETKEGQTITLESKGIDEDGAIVSSFSFHWSVKLKSKK